MSSDAVVRDVFAPAQLGPVQLRNRFVRAGTGESMARPDGTVGDDYVRLHEDLARGGVGLQFSGHVFVHPRGRYGSLQAGLHDDATIPGFRKVTDAVHRQGGRIFAQLAHAGSQSMSFSTRPLAPSAVDNVMTGRRVEAATSEEIDEVVAAFGAAARRAMEAGFDGVHLHGANGYLVSEFRSPLTNERTDRWGGSQEARDRFPVAVIEAIRAELPASAALTMKVGVRDLVDEPGGLEVDAAVEGVRAFVAAGVDAVEVSSNLMSDYVSASIRAYVATDRTRALQDLLFHRLHKSAEDEAYFLPFARAVRAEVETQIVLVGGMRRMSTIRSVVEGGSADFVSMARPFIREPDLVRRLESGRSSMPACVSCNICLMHDEHHALRCWRTPRRNLLEHAVYRLRGGFKKKGSGRKPSARDLQSDGGGA